jgi:apolipoprotein D and lipocalin family protein
VEAVARLDLERYAGLWHEIARLPMSFQRRCDGETTATYRLNPDRTVAVHNACRTASGETISADGVARQPQPTDEPAKLKVRFAPAWLGWLPSVWADYWVIALDADYRWAMVGEPRRKYLWILAREPQMERALFEELKTRARRMGYDLAPLIVSPRRAG